MTNHDIARPRIRKIQDAALGLEDKDPELGPAADPEDPGRGPGPRRRRPGARPGRGSGRSRTRPWASKTKIRSSARPRKSRRPDTFQTTFFQNHVLPSRFTDENA